MKNRFFASLLVTAMTITSVVPVGLVSTNAEAAEDHLLVHYTFDGEGVNAKDASANAMDGATYGTLEGGEDGVFGQALLVKGGYVQIPKDAVKNVDEISVSVWVNNQRTTKNTRVWDLGLDTKNFLNLFSPCEPGNIGYASALRVNDKADRANGPDRSFEQNSWNHVVVTYSDSEKKIRLFKDGSLVASKDVTQGQTIAGLTRNGLNRAYIGMAQFGVDPNLYAYVDDFRIYDKVLSESDITSMYEEGNRSLLANMETKLDVAKYNGLKDLNNLAYGSKLYLPDEADVEDLHIDYRWSVEGADTGVTVSTDVNGKQYATATGSSNQIAVNLIANIRDHAELAKSVKVPVIFKNVATQTPDAVNVTTVRGMRPKLPETITCNGKTSAYDVTWNYIDQSKYAGPGTFTVTGRVKKPAITVTATVTVSNDYMTNPILISGSNGGSPDPYIHYENGYYYYVRQDFNLGVTVSKAKRLQDLEAAPRIVVFTVNDEGCDNTLCHGELWAPEIFHLKDKDGNYQWYIYASCTDQSGNGATHRMFVWKSDDPNDPQAHYSYVGKMEPETDRWAIDGTVIEDGNGNAKYYVWSGWDGFQDGRQDIYICEMDGPTKLKGDRVMLNTPTEPWETKGHNDNGGGDIYVNEGPQIIYHNGKVIILYTTNFSGNDWYCLGTLTADRTADLMDTDVWEKCGGPLFTQSLDPEEETYSTGHAMVTTSPDGKEEYLIYHAFQSSGGGWVDRSARAVKMSWNGNTPVFGNPVPHDVLMKNPSGTPYVTSLKYEAEEAELTGNATIKEEKRASGRSTVTNVDTDSSITFQVEVPKDGKYLVSLVGNSRTNGHNNKCRQDITIGKDTYTVYHSNYAGGNNGGTFRPCNLLDAEIEGDGIYVDLKKGTLEVSVTENTNASGMADVDYLYLTYQGEEVAPVQQGNEPLVPATPATYTVAYNLNGGTAPKGLVTKVTAGNKGIALVTPQKKGYLFGGWYADSAFKTKVTQIPANLTKNITLYAKWNKVVLKGAPKAKLTINKKKKTLTVKITKKVSGADGYVYVTATDKKFKKNKKISYAKGVKITRKGLKKGKVYYVKVAAYKIDSTSAKKLSSYSKVYKIRNK
ncbi:MAG: family 43 glycosylhydrolase [Lachnospiraceae bacterium]|nr:family 43 glycosylhydrolase [Lachnospiraceae bacterium]